MQKLLEKLVTPFLLAGMILPAIPISLTAQINQVFAASEIQSAKGQRDDLAAEYQRLKAEVPTKRAAWNTNKNAVTRDALNSATQQKFVALMELDQARVAVQLAILGKDQAGRLGSFNSVMGSDTGMFNEAISALNSALSQAGQYEDRMVDADTSSATSGNSAALNELKDEIAAFHGDAVRPAIHKAILAHKMYMLKGVTRIAEEEDYDMESNMESAFEQLRAAFSNSGLYEDATVHANELIQRARDGRLIGVAGSGGSSDVIGNECRVNGGRGLVTNARGTCTPWDQVLENITFCMGFDNEDIYAAGVLVEDITSKATRFCAELSVSSGAGYWASRSSVRHVVWGGNNAIGRDSQELYGLSAASCPTGVRTLARGDATVAWCPNPYEWAFMRYVNCPNTSVTMRSDAAGGLNEAGFTPWFGTPTFEETCKTPGAMGYLPVDFVEQARIDALPKTVPFVANSGNGNLSLCSYPERGQSSEGYPVVDRCSS